MKQNTKRWQRRALTMGIVNAILIIAAYLILFT